MHLSDEWGDLKREFGRYRNDMKWAQVKFEEEERERKDECKRKVLEWIAASKKMEALHKTFQDMRICQGTGRWLFKRYSKIVDWETTERPPENAIWLHGKLGCGKYTTRSQVGIKLTKGRQNSTYVAHHR